MARDGKRFEVGSSDDFSVGRIKIVELDGREVGVIRLSGGELRAIMNRCPHKGAPICKGIVGGVWNSTGPGEITHDSTREVLVCPWHGFEFDLKTGRELFWKRPASLRMYPIEEVDGVIFVTM
jgi:nitrite reductase (NADH) small subunit